VRQCQVEQNVRFDRSSRAIPVGNPSQLEIAGKSRALGANSRSDFDAGIIVTAADTIVVGGQNIVVVADRRRNRCPEREIRFVALIGAG
jgi:hypothetical protein